MSAIKADMSRKTGRKYLRQDNVLEQRQAPHTCHNPFIIDEHAPLLEHQQRHFDVLKVHSQQGGLCLILGKPGTGKPVLKNAIIRHDPKLLEDFPKNHNLILIGQLSLNTTLQLRHQLDIKSRVTYSVRLKTETTNAVRKSQGA